jgi:hypothetical protein
MDESRKLEIRNCLERFNMRPEPKIPDGAYDLREIMESMNWTEDRARRKIRRAVEAGVFREMRIGAKKYYIKIED